MRGGKPGFYPSLKKVVPHPVPFDLFDPFGLSAKASPEKKEKGLLAEINNGRLAMLGIMAFVAEQKIPGSVPALGSLGLKPYAGEVMAPFAAGNADLPYVSEMLGFTSLW
uniref:Chlorophyll a-b binding protein, chloroplastic n=1 Tax=Phaeocystis antarctica TaxID=33657 RepID=A0A7S0I1P5_9EUKA|mmetsp:Transcript_5535/g.12892  ORF Transcript_5535/g.12892 Transcript_5535/m.12892 type:complete len:110 (+) Transcript_5535:3-332(+)